MRSYAIGDIHGHLDKLIEIHRRIDADRAETGDFDAPIVHLGDNPDRGPNVPGVLEFLIAGQKRNEPWIFIRGNHDRMMWLFLQDQPKLDPLRHDLHWLNANIGGRATLAAYGVDVSDGRDVNDIHAAARAAVPAHHLTFLTGLQNSLHRGRVFFCHAGVRPGVAFDAQVEDDLVWIRPEFLNDKRDHGALVVHGHTAIDKVTHAGNRLNIDTGAAYGRALSAVVIEGDDVFELTDQGRVQVHATPVDDYV